jgi:hypothetical protein
MSDPNATPVEADLQVGLQRPDPRRMRMAEENALQQLLVDELKDLYSAENQINVEALQA